MTRRGILAGGASLGVMALVARPWSWGAAAIETVPMENLAPFRRLIRSQPLYSGGAGAAILVGLDAPDPIDPALDARLRGDLTGTLWGDWDGSSPPVPVTYFTDIRCPICRPLEARLRATDNIAVSTREYPVFGAASEAAARAILTAEQQGLGQAMRTRLQRASLGADQRAFAQLADGIGAEPDRFASDFNGEAVTARLQEDRALARIFRLPGTPALIIGRTRVVGAPDQRLLDALVTHEQAAG